jgi:putative membrane protein
MQRVANVLVGLIAALHVYFLVLEMFLWTTPRGLATFGTTQAFANESATLAANQGLYNGFLAAGLVWGLVARADMRRPIQVFFLGCVLVAGLYGGATAKTTILFVQALPAALGLAAVLLTKKAS